VAAEASPTSLQLSLEDKELKKKNEAFVTALKGSVEESARAVGYVCVINGHINSAEIFAGHDLFRRAWPRLLEAAATEAISEQKEKAADEAVSVEKATGLPCHRRRLEGDQGTNPRFVLECLRRKRNDAHLSDRRRSHGRSLASPKYH
jgi:hypothetical protein